MKVGIAMVKEEDIIDVLVVLEAAVILSNLRDVSSAISMLMGLLFALNIDYPKELKDIFEVIQNILMNIGGRQCISLVHGLRNRLLQKAMQNCNCMLLSVKDSFYFTVCFFILASSHSHFCMSLNDYTLHSRLDNYSFVHGLRNLCEQQYNGGLCRCLSHASQ